MIEQGHVILCRWDAEIKNLPGKIMYKGSDGGLVEADKVVMLLRVSCYERLDRDNRKRIRRRHDYSCSFSLCQFEGSGRTL